MRAPHTGQGPPSLFLFLLLIYFVHDFDLPLLHTLFGFCPLTDLLVVLLQGEAAPLMARPSHPRRAFEEPPVSHREPQPTTMETFISSQDVSIYSLYSLCLSLYSPRGGCSARTNGACQDTWAADDQRWVLLHVMRQALVPALLHDLSPIISVSAHSHMHVPASCGLQRERSTRRTPPSGEVSQCPPSLIVLYIYICVCVALFISFVSVLHVDACCSQASQPQRQEGALHP